MVELFVSSRVGFLIGAPGGRGSRSPHAQKSVLTLFQLRVKGTNAGCLQAAEFSGFSSTMSPPRSACQRETLATNESNLFCAFRSFFKRSRCSYVDAATLVMLLHAVQENRIQ